MSCAIDRRQLTPDTFTSSGKLKHNVYIRAVSIPNSGIRWITYRRNFTGPKTNPHGTLLNGPNPLALSLLVVT